MSPASSDKTIERKAGGTKRISCPHQGRIEILVLKADAHKVNTIICECGNEFYSFDDYDFHLTLEETTEKVFAEAAAQKGDGAAEAKATEGSGD